MHGFIDNPLVAPQKLRIVESLGVFIGFSEHPGIRDDTKIGPAAECRGAHECLPRFKSQVIVAVRIRERNRFFNDGDLCEAITEFIDFVQEYFESVLAVPP